MFPERKKVAPGGIKIAPSILSADFSRLGEQVKEAEAGGAGVIHVDVMDGHFVPNITIGPVVVSWIRKITDLPIDVHLMISRPHQYVAAFIEAGADMISFHLEAMPDPENLIADLRGVGVAAGVAINPDTPLERIEPYLSDLDYVLLMSVFPGFSGQSFIPESLGRLMELRRLIDATGKQIELEIDGGIGLRNIGEIAGSGATMVVAGSAIYPANAEARTRELKEAALAGIE